MAAAFSGVLIAVLAGVMAAPASAQSPTDDAPTSQAPTSDTPTSQAPTSQAPTSDTPTSDTSTTVASDEPILVEPEPVVREVVFPVVGPVSFTNTWGACRSGCTRSHKGVDVFGAKLAPLVAVADGTIVAVRRSGLTRAGNMIGIRDADGWYYLYVHLNNDTPGTDDGANPQAWVIPNRLRVGDTVRAGDVVGYLGDSGNAETTPAHLHFEIHQPGVGPIDPTPSVQAAKDAGRVRSVASLASTPEGRAEHLETIVDWYQTLLGREPTDEELFAWADRFDIDFATPDDLIADLAMAPERRNPTGAALRAHQVVVGGLPDPDILARAEEQHRAGSATEAIVASLIESAGLATGAVSDEAFVAAIYHNARGHDPTPRVRSYWLNQLANGRDRASMAAFLADSPGVRDPTWHDLQVVVAFRAALDRLPSDDELDSWRRHLGAGGLLADVVDAIRE